ncbi:MAG: ABC transporter ATP-binding protein [Alphaproteobacteria bacterium]|nr:ABC transporter ATP-binding protein [Alphaproteobacteria bacterium]
MSDAAIELVRINKRFGPVHANKDVSLKVMPGTIHGVIGENGAGKSTLMSILYGFYQADSGEILMDGAARVIRDSHDAIAVGIGMVHQHFMLVETFSVLENVMLGGEGGMLLAEGAATIRNRLVEMSRDYDLDVDPDALISDLPVGARQRVEILKALVKGARILILDEPTGVLTPTETDRLFEILDALRTQGVTVLLITHKLREIMAITDTVSVMRGGEMVAHRATAETNPEELAELMVGRKVLLRVDKKPTRPGEPVITVSNLTIRDAAGVNRVVDASLEIRAGEIVGVAGVSGNGQSELLEALAGIRTPTEGVIQIAGGPEITPGQPSNPKHLRERGIAHVPEDRHRMGLVMPFEARESSILGYHDAAKFNTGPLMNAGSILDDCVGKMKNFDVRPGDPNLKSANFSGGNQQKIVLAREIEAKPHLLLVGQPTRGVDIGAIEFIHASLIEMRDAGAGVLLVSVELDEILSLADRIIVMSAGRIVGTLDAAEADERTIGLLMANVANDEAAA